MTRLSEWTEAKVEEWLAYREGVGLAPDHHYLAAWLDDQRRAALADPETQAAMRADVDPEGAAIIAAARERLAAQEAFEEARPDDHLRSGPPEAEHDRWMRAETELTRLLRVSDKGADTDG